MTENRQQMTPAEVADWARVSERTVRREITNGHLPARRIGAQWRVDPGDLVAWGKSFDSERRASAADEDGADKDGAGGA